MNDIKYHTSLCAVKTSNIMSRVEIDVIVRWLWYFVKHYINSDKIEFSTNLMDYYVTEEDQSGHFGQIPVDTWKLIHQFLTKYFFSRSEII